MKRAQSGILATILVLVAVSASAAPPPNLAEALEAQRRLADETPTAAVLNDLGNLLFLSGRHFEAESVYQRVLTLDARHSEARFNLGLLLQNRGDLASAGEIFEDLVEQYPNNAWAHYQLGVVREAEEDKKEAIASYARALALDPELYFPDVNPQVVSNQLLTQSLLAAADLRRPSGLVPLSYARPRAITELLLSLPRKGEQTGEESQGAEPEEQPAPIDHQDGS
jgi:tetratricopeptide (TPR) repeat protein